MKKIALLLIVAAFAATPAAAAKKRMTAQQKADAKAMETNEQSWRIVRDGMPLVLPTWAQVIYFGTGMDQHYGSQSGKKTKKKRNR
jgi:hypothetical protein